MTEPVGPELALTRSILAQLEPSSWEHVAAFLNGILLREPVKSGMGWERERVVLGSLMADLRIAAASAGEEPSAPLFPRAPGQADAERSARERAELGKPLAPEDEAKILEALAAERQRSRELDREFEALRASGPAPLPASAPVDDLPAWA